jgi:hypothetical protein
VEAPHLAQVAVVQAAALLKTEQVVLEIKVGILLSKDLQVVLVVVQHRTMVQVAVVEQVR